MTGAELAARATAARATLADFRRAADDYLDHGAAEPHWSTWAFRMLTAASSVLDGMEELILPPGDVATILDALTDAIGHRTGKPGARNDQLAARYRQLAAALGGEQR